MPPPTRRMPSKGAVGAGDGKKKKKTKKQKREEERRRKEEEERARIAAEEEQRRLEEEERKRQEEERKRREAEREQRRADVEQRLHAEALMMQPLDSIWKSRMRAYIGEVQEALEWERVQSGSRLPKVLSKPDLNAYLSVLSDQMKTLPLPQCLQQLQELSCLVELLRKGQSFSICSDNETMLSFYHSYLESLFDELKEIVDRSTAHILQYADRYQEEQLEKQREEMEKQAAANPTMGRPPGMSVGGTGPGVDRTRAIGGGLGGGGAGLILQEETDDVQYGIWVNLAKNPRIKSIDFPTVGCVFEIPKSLALASVAMRVVQLHNDESSRRHVAGSLRPYGSMFEVALFGIPPGPKSQRGWTLRIGTQSDDKLRRMNYPLTSQAESALASNYPPIRVTMNVRKDSVIRTKTPLVGWWSEGSNSWVTDDIQEVEYDAEKHTVSFLTMNLTYLSLLCNPTAGLPYEHWYTMPLESDTGDLYVRIHWKCASESDIRDEFRTVIVDVGAEGCYLREPSCSQLASAVGVPHTPYELIDLLNAAGIIMTVSDQEATLGELPLKSSVAEEHAYHQMALLSVLYGVHASKWNSHAPQEFCLYKVSKSRLKCKEDGIDEAIASAEWDTFLTDEKRSALTTISDADEEYTYEPYDTDEEISRLTAPAVRREQMQSGQVETSEADEQGPSCGNLESLYSETSIAIVDQVETLLALSRVCSTC